MSYVGALYRPQLVSYVGDNAETSTLVSLDIDCQDDLDSFLSA